MLVVHVHVRVKPEFIDAFREASHRERAEQRSRTGDRALRRRPAGG